MIKRTEIKGKVFIEQTTFHVYKSEEDVQLGKPYIVTSNKDVFNTIKENLCLTG